MKHETVMQSNLKRVAIMITQKRIGWNNSILCIISSYIAYNNLHRILCWGPIQRDRRACMQQEHSMYGRAKATT